MSGKRMHIRKCKDGSYRMRIYRLHEDDLDTIKQALDGAREELNTEFDSVAIEAICMNYLSSGNFGTAEKVRDHGIRLFVTATSCMQVAATLINKVRPLTDEQKREVVAYVLASLMQDLSDLYVVAYQKGPEAVEAMALSMHTWLESEKVSQ